MDTDTLSIADDRLVGVEAIAAFRGEPVQRTRYLVRAGLLPCYREGRRIVASRRALRAQHVQRSQPPSEDAGR